MKNLNQVKALVVSTLLIFSSISFAAEAPLTDSEIIANIKTQFAADKTTSDLNVNVVIHNGTVVLSGQVNTETEADKLIQIAESNNGVKDVETDQLTVKESKHSMSDTAITAKVKGMYLREKLFSEKDISMMGVSVETTNGIVYLTGQVKNKVEKDNAIKYAKLVHGVKNVEAKLEVKAN
jgi:hyperosmotically inducible protein